VMDTGSNFEIHANRRSASATFIFSIVMTALVWALVLAR
jgi:succinate dehydrogenase/fumarate reductase cytochrome b subunit